MMNEKQVIEKITRLRIEIDVLEDILNTKEIKTMGRPLGSWKYNDKEINFLTDNKDMEMKILIKTFNEEFNTNFDLDSRALYNFMIRSKIISKNYEKERYLPAKPTRLNKSWQTRDKKLMEDLNIKENGKD